MTDSFSRRASLALAAGIAPFAAGAAASSGRAAADSQPTQGFGPFVTLGKTEVPAGTRLILSSGYRRDGDLGHAWYREMDPGEPGYGVATRFRAADARGRWFQLAETVVTPFMLGAQADYYRPDGSINPRPTDDHDAIQQAVDGFGAVFFASKGGKTGYWTGAPIIVPTGTYLWGRSTMGSMGVAPRATVIASANGDCILNLRTNKAHYVTIEGLTLYCPDRSTHGIDVTPQRTTLRDLHILRCNVGIGGVSGAYGEHSNFFNVHCYGCNYGARRLRDTRWYGGRIAASRFDGINLPPGANDNKFDVKIDFNDGWGINAESVMDLTIFSENIDRNGKGGIRLVDCQRVGGRVNLQRNGNKATSEGEGAHLYLKGCRQVSLDVMTGTGREDNGTGVLSPRHAVVLDGGGNSAIAIDGDLTGQVDAPISALNGATAAGISTRGAGAASAPGLANVGMAVLAPGRSATISLALPAGAGGSVTPLLLAVAASGLADGGGGAMAMFPLLVGSDRRVEVGTAQGGIGGGERMLGFDGQSAIQLSVAMGAGGALELRARTRLGSGITLVAELK